MKWLLPTAWFDRIQSRVMGLSAAAMGVPRPPPGSLAAAAG
jgi:hypothetical protein